MGVGGGSQPSIPASQPASCLLLGIPQLGSVPWAQPLPSCPPPDADAGTHSSGIWPKSDAAVPLSLGRSWKTPTRCPERGVGGTEKAQLSGTSLSWPGRFLHRLQRLRSPTQTRLRERLVLLTAWQLGWPITGWGTSPRQGLAFSRPPALWLLARPACFQFFWGVPLRLRSWTTRLSPGASEQVPNPVCPECDSELSGQDSRMD